MNDVESGSTPIPRAHLRHIQGVDVIHLEGPADGELVGELCDLLDNLVDDSVIVDVSDLTLVDPCVVRDLVSLVLLDTGGDGCCLVTRRESSRAVLRQVGGFRVPIFHSVPDAAQAKLFAAEGHGSGWHQAAPAPELMARR